MSLTHADCILLITRTGSEIRGEQEWAVWWKEQEGWRRGEYPHSLKGDIMAQ